MHSFLTQSVIVLFFSFILCAVSYGQPVSVDPLTGRAQISIPIWNISEGDLNAPISVTYSGGGVRVEESEGTAGMSWNLIAGGAVSREVRGLPDDYNGTGSDLRKGWLLNGVASTINSFTPTSDDNLTICSDEVADYNFFTGFTYAKDPEPDIFYFHAPGLSGQFVLGVDGLPKLFPYQDLKVEVIRPSNLEILQVKITNNVGVTYVFNYAESVTRDASGGAPSSLQRDWNYFNTPLTYYGSWKLSQITSPGGAEISFGYTPEEQAVPSVNEICTYSEGGVKTVLYTMKEAMIVSKLTTITTDATTATLTWEQERISFINILDNHYNLKKEFTFIYGSARDYRIPFDMKRFFLVEIQEVQAISCSAYPSHVFTYEGVDFATESIAIPFSTRNYQDLWGYYNGTSDDKRPDIFVYNTQAGAEKFRYRLIPGQTPDQILMGSNRVVNASVIATGSLTGILSPSGAQTTILYEPNTYFDDIANESVEGGGVRVKTITLSGFESGSENIVTNYEYNRADGQSSGKLLYRPVFAFANGTSIVRTPDNQAPEGGVMYLRSVVKQTGKGQTIYDFLMPAAYPSTSYSTDWTATKSKVARQTNEPGQPCVSIGNLVNGFYSYPFAPNTNYDFERGLIDKITDKAENGTTVRERLFTYSRFTTTALKVKGLRIENLGNHFVYAPYSLITNVGKATVTETSRVADELAPSNLLETITTYTYNTTHQMLESMSTTNSDGVIFKTTYKYAKDFIFTTVPTQPEAIALKALITSNQHGRPVETISYRKVGAGAFVAIGASLTLYKDFGSNKILPYKSLAFPAQTGFTQSVLTGTPQSFSWHAAYIPGTTIQNYNPLGLPLSITDNNKNKSGIHYGFSNSSAIATVSNALVEETVYDGFETSSTTSLTIPAGTDVTGWTGRKAKAISAGTILSRANIQKGSTKYRFSCRVKTSGAANVTFTLIGNVTLSQSVAYNSASPNTWQYLEGNLDLTTLTASTFNLQVSANANIELDDVRLLPWAATMVVTSTEPLTGSASVSDDRGVSAFKEFDSQGRLRFVKDRNKDLVQVTDYAYKRNVKSPLRSSFTSSVSGSILQGTSVTFTATSSNCVPVIYTWKVGSQTIVQPNSSTYVHTFSNSGFTQVELTVTSASGNSSTTTSGFSSYCVKPVPGDLTINVTGSLDIWECSGDFARSAIAVPSTRGGCTNTLSPDYKWYYKLISSNQWVEVSISNQLTFNVSSQAGVLESYYLKCVYSATCQIVGGECPGDYPYTRESTVFFTYHDEATCN